MLWAATISIFLRVAKCGSICRAQSSPPVNAVYADVTASRTTQSSPNYADVTASQTIQQQPVTTVFTDTVLAASSIRDSWTTSVLSTDIAKAYSYYGITGPKTSSATALPAHRAPPPLREGHPPCKKLDVGLLVVILLGLCTTYSSRSPVVTTTSIILCFNKHRLTHVHLENGHYNRERDTL